MLNGGGFNASCLLIILIQKFRRVTDTKVAALNQSFLLVAVDSLVRKSLADRMNAITLCGK